MSDSRAASASGSRIASIDVMRGLVMVVMTLDHTRDFFSNQLDIDPSDPAKTSVALYVTRFVSHFCAPVFVLLAGTGAGLMSARWPHGRLATFLLTRGLWLVILELTLVRLGFWFSFDFSLVIGMVIWVLGWSMVVLAGIVFAPRGWPLIFGVSLILIHNACDGFDPIVLGPAWWVWPLLHGRGEIILGGGYELVAPYKLIPWAGVMACGYSLADLYLGPRDRRCQWLVGLGLGMIVAFVVLRATQIYGEPRPWAVGASITTTLMAFFRCSKYPPSLCFLLMTLGPSLLLLAWLDREPGWLGRRLSVLGRVPLFFYLLHLPLIHGLAILVSVLQRGRVEPWLLQPPQSIEVPPDYGFDLPVVYCATLLVVAILYPLCLVYGRWKRNDRTGILSWL